ncbi:MAG: isoaspartyl peptidase/L-asparaginase [Nitrospinales bacterium]
MTGKKYTIAAHGGAGSANEHADGTERAVQRCLQSLRSGASVLESVCQAVATLEDDPRFNAGTGSSRRTDGSAQMDAACMDSGGQFGAVTVLEGFKNPIHIAHAVSKTEYLALAGPGAAEFARGLRFPASEPRRERATTLSPPPETGSSDTVGAVGFDGETFAAALSTGGRGGAIPGRVGDVPLIGCGLFAGPSGAVAATGDGEKIAMQLTAFRAYQMLERGADPEIVLKTALTWFEETEAAGLILVSRKGFAGGASRAMAWSGAEAVA